MSQRSRVACKRAHVWQTRACVRVQTADGHRRYLSLRNCRPDSHAAQRSPATPAARLAAAAAAAVRLLPVFISRLVASAVGRPRT